jgi:hypothetical protein
MDNPKFDRIAIPETQALTELAQINDYVMTNFPDDYVGLDENDGENTAQMVIRILSKWEGQGLR